MRVRTAIFTGAATVGVLIVPMLAAAPARASGPPWPDGTVVIASTGMRTGSGLLTVIDPASGERNLDHVSVQDVAVASDGSVYYVSCNGAGLYEYSPATGGVYALSYRVGSCPNALAIQPNGDLLVSSVSGRYEVAPDGSPVGSDPSAPQDGSLAIDSDGDVYASSGSQELTVTPVGGSTVAIQGLFDGAGINAVRLDGSGDLVASSPNGKAYVQPPTRATPAAEYDTGYYADGVAIDGAGNVYVSALAHSNQNGDQVDEFAPGAGSPTVLARNVDTPRGLATYPSPTTPSRSASSVVLTTNARRTNTTASRITLTATVDGGASGLTGLVQFASGGRPLGDVVPMSDGVATLTTQLPAGEPAHVTATYLGSAAERPSQAEQDVTVTMVRSTTTLTAPTTAAEAGPVPVGASVAFADGTHPNGGTVDFRVVAPNGQTSDDYERTDADGTATASLVLGPGTSRVSAIFQSDGYHSQSQSAVQRVTTTAPYRPTMAGTERIGQLKPNGTAPVTLQIGVKGVPAQYTGGTATPPTGTVTADHGFTCGALTPSTTGAGSRATCTGVGTLGDSYDVAVSYSGDATYVPAQESFPVGLGG